MHFGHNNPVPLLASLLLLLSLCNCNPLWNRQNREERSWQRSHETLLRSPTDILSSNNVVVVDVVVVDDAATAAAAAGAKSTTSTMTTTTTTR